MKNNNKLAFTLAETLIAITVIGVIAAVTIPVTIVKHRNKILESQFKTGHALIAQAVRQMSIDYDDISDTFCGSTRKDRDDNMFIQNFAKYFTTTKHVYTITYDLTKLGYKQTYFSLSNSKNQNYNADGHDNGGIILNNGMIIMSSGCWWYANYVDFTLDTNGVKGPNRVGYDVFYFQIQDKNKLAPDQVNYYLATYDDNKVKNCCNFKERTCSIVTDTGCTCALYALRNKNPNDDTKSYWETLP